LKKTCIIILGMHRSGTSALTGLLNKYDIDLGKELLGAHISNKKGHFENKKVVLFNEQLLAMVNSNWADSMLIDKESIRKICDDKNLVKKAREIIHNEFGNSNNIAIKDPRISLLLPFWLKVLELDNYNVVAVLSYRDPLEVASSLLKRNNFKIEYSINLWLKYSYYAELYSRNIKRIFISYDQLISNPKKILDLICTKLNIQNITCSKSDVEGFVEKDLRNSIKNILKEKELPIYMKNIIKILEFNSRINSSNNDNIQNLDEEYKIYILNHLYFLNNTSKILLIEDFKEKEKNKTIRRKIKRFTKKLQGKY